jgi:membrane associated rhomboid family serine protease
MNNLERHDELLSFQLFYNTRKAKATWALAIVIGLLFLLEELFGGSTNTNILMRMGANSSERVFEGEYWRLLSSVFLHAGFMHVLLNSYVLYALGSFFNRILGDSVFLTIFFISGISGSLASTFLGSAKLSVGASGAIWGIFGASLALSFIKNPLIPELIRLNMRKVTLINLALNLGVSFLPMVDIWAHLGGGLGGFVTSLLVIYLPQIRKYLFFIGALLLSIAYGASITMALISYKPWVNQLTAPLKPLSLHHTPFSIALPEGLTLSEEPLKHDKSIRFNFGDLSKDQLALEIHILNASLIGQPLNNSWLSAQRNELLSDAKLDAQLRKTIDLRTTNTGDILFFQQELKNKIKIYNYLFIRANYLFKLIIITPEQKQLVIENMASKIIASIK